MIILDTHIWYWWTNSEHEKLSKTILNTIEEADEVAISAVSCLEITWLVKKQQLTLACELSEWFDFAIEKSGLISVPVSREIATLSGQLPEHHKDPLDRIIIATAILNSANLISVDGKFPLYQELNGLLIK
jgi:PIN domain nuclease of toxin-antitoxin system